MTADLQHTDSVTHLRYYDTLITEVVGFREISPNGFQFLTMTTPKEIIKQQYS